MKIKQSKRTSFPKTVLAVAIAMALAPVTSYAALKPSDIKDLPQTGNVTGIRSGKGGNGVVITWSTDGAVYAQRILNTGALNGSLLDIATDAAIPAGLAVKPDGSFIAAWPTSSDVMAVKVAGSESGTPFSVAAEITDKPVQVFDQAAGYAIAWDSSLVNFDDTDQPGEIQPIGAFSSIAMDSSGDFFVPTTDGSSLTVNKNNADTLDIAPSQTISNYGFDEGKNKNKSVGISVTDPTIVSNSAGDFVVVWHETKTEDTRKTKKVCDTYNGYKTCENVYTYSSSSSTSFLARRYSNTLGPKDTKPVVVARTKGAGTYINDVSVVLDADGDFTVAYAKGKSTYTYKADGGITTDQSDVFVRQFAINKAKKLAAGKAIKVSAKPKLLAKHILKNSTNREPSVVVIDESKNAFIVTWHNDFEDHYKDYENLQQVCAKYKTTKDEYGYAYKECVLYKDVPTDASDSLSLLKAKRYSK